MLSKIFKGHDVLLVPILVGNLTRAKEIEYGKLLAPYLDDEETLFVISTDFCHWGEDFDYMPHDEKLFGNKIWKSIEALDQQGIALIEDQNQKTFFDYCEKSGNTICGRHVIGMVLAALAENNNIKTKTKFVCYSQSEKVTSCDQCSVSYASSVTVAENR